MNWKENSTTGETTVVKPDKCTKISQLNKDVFEIAYSKMLEQLGLNPDLKNEYDKEKLESIIREVETNLPHNPAKSSAMYLTKIINSKPFKIGSNQMINEKMAVLVCELSLCMNGYGEVQTMANDTLNLMADMIVSDGAEVDEITEMIRKEIMVRH